jgi:hypothetical protein
MFWGSDECVLWAVTLTNYATVFFQQVSTKPRTPYSFYRATRDGWPNPLLAETDTHPAAQNAGHELPVVSAVEEYGPAGRLIQPVQQPDVALYLNRL